MARVMVICDEHYNGNQLWMALAALTGRGHMWQVFSTSEIIVDEQTGERQVTHGVIGNLRPNMFPEQYQAFMMLSGRPKDTEAYWHDEAIKALVEMVNTLGLPLAAICFSVPSIRWAARDKRVTCYPIIRARQLLEDAGAIYSPLTVVRDFNLVTAEHEMATKTWAREFCNLIEGKPSELLFQSSSLVPGARVRRTPTDLTELKDTLSQAYRAREGQGNHTAITEAEVQGGES